MKKCLLYLLICTIGVTAQAVLIDDFEDTSLAEYIKSVTLVHGASQTTTFGSPSGMLQVTKTGTAPHQVLFLRDDYSLGVNQILRVDATVAPVSGFNCDFGIAVSAEVDPDDVIWEGSNVEDRHDYLYMYIKGGSSGWGSIGFDGYTQVAGSGYVTGQDLSVITGLFINRVSDTTFEVGYSTEDGDTVYSTLIVSSLSGSYNAVGFYSDIRSNATYGYFDNFRIESYPHEPSVDQAQDTINDTVDATLHWKAALDTTGTYTVDPDIVDQYVFISKGIADPNLYYAGATSVDESSWSLADPNSSFVAEDLAYDDSYDWAVVEALDGYAHNGTDNPVLSVGDPINLVDPNNIIGPTWSFDSLLSIAMIVQEPSDARVFTTDPSAAFTVEFTSVNPATATWYKDDVALTGDETDVSINTTSTDSTLTIATPTLTDEGKYYCVLSVEEGPDDDIQSATRLLIIKQLLAQYTFDNASDRLENTGDITYAPDGQGKSVEGLSDPNEMQATNVTLTYVTGIEDTAVYLNGSQYIDLDPNGYPKAGPLDTIGDARGEGYEKSGWGRGMEEGSILCWVKPNTIGAILANFNTDITGFGFSTETTNNARNIVRGENFDGGYQAIGTASGGLQMDEFSLQDGQWHMVASTWDNDTVRVYINGELVNSNTSGVPEVYRPWNRSVLMGASRSSVPNRHILSSLLDGAIDSLRVYNYVITDAEIATEYEALSGNKPCLDHNFAGSYYNTDNTSASYCQVDLTDFADFAETWLSNGF